MKTKFFSLNQIMTATLLAIALCCHSSLLKAQSEEASKKSADQVYNDFAQEEKLFSTSVGNLLALEDQPPTDGTKAIPVTLGLELNILNLLAAREDYFGLLTPEVLAKVQDNAYQDSEGLLHHHYVAARPGEENMVLGYLTCLDQQKTKKLVSDIAHQAGGDSYTFYNDVQVTQKSLLINLEYDYLSPEVIDHLYADYYDTENQGVRNQANYVWLDKRSFTGEELQESNLPQTVFTLGLYVSLDDTSDDSGWDEGSLYKRNDKNGNYHPKNGH